MSKEETIEKIPITGISTYICTDCGIQFLSEEQMKRASIITFHIGECYICKQEKAITHSRAYNFCIKKED